VVVHYQIEGATSVAISQSVESAIRTGTLGPGAPLPPVRTLAGQLRVSPATVAAAYRALRDRGLVETAGRNGTRVRARPPVAARLARRPPVPDGVLDLSAGEPDVALLPDPGPRLRRIAGSAGPIGYPAEPLPELIEAARVRLRPVPTDHLTVTGGALDGVERVLTAHLRPGDRVAVEDPGWANLFDLVAALGLHPVPIPVDDEGPTEDRFGAALRSGVAAAVVTSRAQNPTGAAVTAGRARRLRHLLRRYRQTLLIEDDHAAELADGPLHPLVGVTERWAFVRSTSKPYGPDLRLAVVAGDETTVARVAGRMRLGTGWVSTILQRLVVEMWSDPVVADTVARAGEEYRRRRGALLDALRQRGIVARAVSGINVWVPVVDETLAVTRLRDSGFAVAPGSLYRLAAPLGVRVTVSALPEAAVAALADALAEAAQARGTVRPAR
jgi:DNA-binding transcriptional MocR family regulator